MKKVNNFIGSLLALLFLYACSPTGILATGGGSAMVIAEGDRSVGSVIDDATIKVNIAAKFINSQDNLFVDISTTVLDGRVLLTGLVDNQETRIEAVRKVWEVDGYLNDSPEKFFDGIANFGSSNGKLLPETVYFYVLDLGDTDIDGNSVSEETRYRKGIVYIRRPNE